MFTPKKPQLSSNKMDINAWRKNNQDISKLLNIKFDPSKFTLHSDGSGTYISLSSATTTTATMVPFQIYVSPDAANNSDGTPNAAGWRTVRVHTGTENNSHPVGTGSGANQYSDDADVSNGAVLKEHTDMVLSNRKKYFVLLVQTRKGTIDVNYNVDWTIDKTWLSLQEDFTHDYDSENPSANGDDTDNKYPFDGYPSGNLDIYNNVHYAIVGHITVGSDQNTDTDYHSLIIDQFINYNLEGNQSPTWVQPVAWQQIGRAHV